MICPILFVIFTGASDVSLKKEKKLGIVSVEEYYLYEQSIASPSDVMVLAYYPHSSLMWIEYRWYKNIPQFKVNRGS